MSHPALRYTLLAFATGALFALIWTALTLLEFHDNRVIGYWQLVNHHSLATAHATSTHCGDHGRVDYAFDVQGNTFAGETFWLETPCSKISPGYTFAVNYNIYDPTFNSTMQPDAAFSHHLWQFCFMVLYVSGLVFIIMRDFWRKKRPNYALKRTPVR
ncbi:MAG: hypothetical protein JSR64_19455 [Nitrospira sp.]|nr:hypothetical protein [Nitrospira sp.]MBS0193994.1 hypothetical protein [Pseudomonadota bacterium]